MRVRGHGAIIKGIVLNYHLIAPRPPIGSLTSGRETGMYLTWAILSRSLSTNMDLILDSCVLREDYRATDGHKGQSFTIYDTARNVWHQTG